MTTINTTDHPLYSTWRSMRGRCSNPNLDAYPWYGAKGITVCDRWNSFTNFVEDMGERPEGFTLDRINSDQDYSPSNCRWASVTDQLRNRILTNPMRNIRKEPNCNTYRVRIVLTPGTEHSKSFQTLEEAIDYRDELTYEREFHYSLGL